MKILIIGPFPPRKAAEADHTFYLSQHLADRGLDVHVLTVKGSISPKHPSVRIHPIMKDWSWSDLPRLRRMIRHCSPDAVLLVYTRGVYDGHPMITFSPTVCKKLLPQVLFVTLFEDAPSIPAAAFCPSRKAGYADQEVSAKVKKRSVRTIDRILVRRECVSCSSS